MKRATCLRLDVDQNRAEAERFQVNSIPRLLLLSSDGKKILWDTMGYRDAQTFAQEFGEALGVKDTGARAISATPEPPELTKVSAALSDGTFHRLLLSDPKAGRSGLKLLVEKLGAFDEKEFKAEAELVKKAGPDAVPALIEGMGSKVLAVRVGSYKVIQNLLPKADVARLKFNPWAPGPTRSAQLASWGRLSAVGR